MSNIIDFDFYRKFHVVLCIEKEDLKFFIESSIRLLLNKTREQKKASKGKKITKLKSTKPIHLKILKNPIKEKVQE